jgi:hypothetical protein
MQLTNQLCQACQSSGQYNRFCKIKSCTELKMLKDFRDNQIYKIQEALFFVGSKYETRMTNWIKEDYQSKRPSYYKAVIENNMIQALIKKPDQYYFNVWTELTQKVKSVYIDSTGKILKDYENEVLPYICKPSGSEQRVRKYHLENIFFLRINGKLFKDDIAYTAYNRFLI